MVQMLLPNNDAIFKDDNSPIHTATSVQFWFEEHEDALQQLPWSAQSPDSNAVEQLWSILDSRVRSRILPPSTSQATRERRAVQYSSKHYSELNMSLFQEGYQLYYRQMVTQLRIHKEMHTFHNRLHYFVQPL
jgi:transposase